MSDAYPSFRDLAAYPQFVLAHVEGCRGGDDIPERPAGGDWIHRMPPYLIHRMHPYLVGGVPASREHVRRRALP